MSMHRVEVMYQDGDFSLRPGWRMRCSFCRHWHYTDQDEDLAYRVADEHEETGTWPQT